MAGEDHFLPEPEPNLLEEEEPDMGKYARPSSFIEMMELTPEQQVISLGYYGPSYKHMLPSVEGPGAQAPLPMVINIPAPLHLAPIERNAPPRNAPEIDQTTDDETDTESGATDEVSEPKP